MKIYALVLLLFLTGCNYLVIPESDGPVYKYNVLENRTELTHPESELRYNVFSREWVYVR